MACIHAQTVGTLKAMLPEFIPLSSTINMLHEIEKTFFEDEAYHFHYLSTVQFYGCYNPEIDVELSMKKEMVCENL